MSAFAHPIPVVFTVQSTALANTVTEATPAEFTAVAVHVGLRGPKGDRGLKGDVGDVNPLMVSILEDAEAASTSAQASATTATTAVSVVQAARDEAVAARSEALSFKEAAQTAAEAAETFNPSNYVPKVGGVLLGGDLAVPSLNGGQLAGHRNKLINPFTENQRAATSVADDTYCLDRWYVLTESGNVTVAQVTDPESGAPSGIRLTQPDATAKRIGLAQIIESRNIRQHAGQAMNLFARVKLSAGTAIRYAVLEHAGTVDVVTSDVVNNWASTNFTTGNFFIAGLNVVKTGTVTPGAATWGQINDWSALGASVKNVVIFFWTESPLAQNGTLEINRPQYEPGVIATPHEWRLNELTLCQRYYLKSIAVLAQSSFGGSEAINNRSFPVQMRTTPTIVTTPSSGSGGTFSASDGMAFYQSALNTVAALATIAASAEL